MRRLFEHTGLVAEDITTLCQLLAAAERTPDILSRAARLLFIPDLVRWILCGVQATDFTLATTSQMYDIRGGGWDTGLLAELRVPESILPPVRRGHSVAGVLDPRVQAETGLDAVPVTIGASHDTAAAFMTQPAEDDTAILSSGTWSMLGVHLPAPVFPPDLDPTRFGHEGNPDGTVRLLCNIPGMWILEKCRDAWARRGVTLAYDALVAGAGACASFNSRIDPYDQAFSLPADMAEAVASHCARTGQPVPATPFETARAIFLGLAESYAGALQELSSLSGRRFRRLRVIGGGVRNQLLNVMIEQRTGVEVLRGEAEATAVGNILSQERALAVARQEAPR
jgi:rhamnulokinase